MAHMRERTPEEIKAALELAHKASADKKAFNLANEHKYKLDYMDSNHWSELASKYKVRMPAYNEPCTPKGLRKYMKRTGVSNDVWKEHYTSIDYFIDNNPKFVLYAAVGLMLEIKDSSSLPNSDKSSLG